MNTLFNYQEAVVPDLLACLRPDNPTLLVAPTGSGKTVIAADIARRYRNVLFVAHRIEIVEQARAQMGESAQCMSIHQALHHGPPRADLLIIDEAHRATANTYRQIIEKYRGACVLGMTATPRRTDGQGLIDVFSEIVECSSVAELVEAGYLVPYLAFEAPDEALKQLPHLRRKMGDYAPKELSALVNQPRLVGDVVREYQKHGKGRKAIAFAVSVEHSKAMTAAFLSAGVRAVHLDGRAPAKVRAKALKDLADGALDVLCSVNLFTEGWDCPSVSCVIMARPTASLTLYLQSVGRGMRTALGKRDLLILDHAGNIERHGPPDMKREWSLESEQQKAKREAEQAELERLWSLGYDSIEAELEAKRREREEIAREWVTSKYVNKQRSLLGQKGGGCGKWAKLAGITSIPNPQRPRTLLYSKKEIDAAISEMQINKAGDEWITGAEVKQLCGLSRPNGWARRNGIRTRDNPKNRHYKLYSRNDVEAAIDKLESVDTQSWMTNSEVSKLIGSTSANTATWANRNQIAFITSPLSRNYRLYSRAEVEAALAKRVKSDPLPS